MLLSPPKHKLTKARQLGHGAIWGGDDEDAAVHLAGALLRVLGLGFKGLGCAGEGAGLYD